MSDNGQETERLPKYEFKNGDFYCDGIRVMPWQLTEDEVHEYIPKPFWDKYLKNIVPCPFDGCLYWIETGDNIKRIWTQHVRNAHRDWYAINGKKMQECADYEEFVAFVNERQNIGETRMDK